MGLVSIEGRRLGNKGIDRSSYDNVVEEGIVEQILGWERSIASGVTQEWSYRTIAPYGMLQQNSACSTIFRL